MRKSFTATLAALGALTLASAPAAHADGVDDDGHVFSCVDDGDRVCGPLNFNGVTPGCYDDGGVLEFAWPCSPWQPRMGWRHADGTTTYPNGDVMDDDGNLLVVGDHSHDISSQLASGPHAWDDGAYVGGFN